MRAIRLPNGNVLIPIERDDSGNAGDLAEVGPDQPEFGKWLPFGEDGEDPRPPVTT